MCVAFSGRIATPHVPSAQVSIAIYPLHENESGLYPNLVVVVFFLFGEETEVS